MLRKSFTILLAILLLASPVSAFFSFDFSISQSSAITGATIATEAIADTMVSNYIDENHPEYSGAYTAVSLIFDPMGKIVGKLSSNGVKYANKLYEYSKKADNGKNIVNSDDLNKIFDKDIIEEFAKKESKGYSPKTVAGNAVNLLDEGVEPENINKLFKDAVKNDKKLGWIDNRISKLKDKGVEIKTTNNIIKNSDKPNNALKKAVDETNKLSKMGISKSSISKITKNANNIDDLTKQRKVIGDLKRRKISKEAINKLIENGYDLEKSRDVIKELRNKGIKTKTINKLIENGYDVTKFNKEFKAITNSDPKLMKKLAKYINSWDIKRINPLDVSGGSQKLVKVFNARGIRTIVKDKDTGEIRGEVNNFAVLKVGNDKFGLKHIINRHEADFKKIFNIKEDDEIIKKIKETLESPSDKPKYGLNPKIGKYGKYEYHIYKKFGDNQYLLIALDDSGSITTAIPTTKYSKVETFMDGLE
ncbi:hypothetical protein [Methanococcus aeolicus]|uniref:Uncharacterized protein n=1 Tax=Methanococcus aeolicus (strain ATCC BAA-1280 / DSM 17508 / OCM 812 / Nankai-3) TaxID=419665 RepID=A6UU60_META3|nr:hypothetical protein [Methanococcus aeolicus]ABR56032.1 hypothetical protein Maeo_0446 [Methanococcus aeolicus Nankai-3]UXM85363.1 hypothetical protein N6C89_03555 [Methanococcus aeolicus]